jgi:DNA-binding transcriptional regulator YiaG
MARALQRRRRSSVGRSSLDLGHTLARVAFFYAVTFMRSHQLAAKPDITSAQIRAARSFLGWSVRELSQRSGVSESAISRAERSEGIPGMQARNLKAVRTAFEIHGIEFLDQTGLRIRGR